MITIIFKKTSIYMVIFFFTKEYLESPEVKLHNKQFRKENNTETSGLK